jgi:toxin ParE1/3/4
VTRVIISPEADADSGAILSDLAAQAGPRVADRYEADFDAVYERLAVFPQLGAPRARLSKDLRMCIVLPYLIFYEYLEAKETVTILRIVHGKRKITRKFLMDR